MVFPRWAEINIYREYKAVIRIFIPIKIIVELAHENEDVIMINSPIKLIEGGRARLARLPSIHHVPIKGKIVCIPRARIIVRLWIRS